MSAKDKLMLAEQIESHIYWIRSKKVMLDRDLANLYGVETKVLNRAVKRNIKRFPTDFMFQLTSEEFENLRCQFDTSKKSHGGRRYLPYVFTEHGAVMLASILNSPVAIQASVQVVRAFVRLRKMLISHADLKKKIEAMEAKYDTQFKVVFDALRQLITPKGKPKSKIGFGRGKEG